MNPRALATLAVALVAAPLAASAQAPQDALYVKSLAATCANCHGTDGNTAAGSPLPTLAGMSRDNLVAQLKAFKSGARPATIMHQLSRGYSDAQIEQLATYFATQKK
jgi:sulfide dehydrogenase cytochrome subunit